MARDVLMRAVGSLLAITATACGDNTNPAIDMMPDADVPTPDAFVYNGPCWPEEMATPQGSLILGATGPGQSGFEPMPETLPIVYGLQDGYMFIVNIRMTGFAPGNPTSYQDPMNPRTRIRAYFADTGATLQRGSLAPGGECPVRVPYLDNGAGAYELITSYPIVFDTCWRSDNLVGKQFRIEAELLDYAGTAYASDTRIVTAGPAEGIPPEQGNPGCQ
jgi:hypothetical protein